MFLNENVTAYDVQPMNESYIDGSEASMYRILYESSEEWATLTEKSLKMQATAMLREDTALLSEGLSEVWEKVKDFFVKLWARIKQFFSKFWSYITGLVAMDKKWINKNQKLLDGLNIKEFTVEIHPIIVKDSTANIDKAIVDGTDLEGLAFSIKDEKDAIDKIKEKFTTDKEESLLGGSREQVDITSSEFKQCVAAFKGIDKVISLIKKVESNINKLFTSIVKYVDTTRGAFKHTNGDADTYDNATSGGSKFDDKNKKSDADTTKLKNAKLAAGVAGTAGSALTWALKEVRADLKKVILKGLGSRMFKDEEKAHLEESYDFGVLSQF